MLRKAGALQETEFMFALEFARGICYPADRERGWVGVSGLALHVRGPRPTRYAMKLFRQLRRKPIDETV
ncbi:MAG: hypothetical protein E6K53_02795 [Gammaproteobacteria bacterium]|nr:MAG: hypothetical protein E6K53_02795 [Gammaproteobacteria bacterium]